MKSLIKLQESMKLLNFNIKPMRDDVKGFISVMLKNSKIILWEVHLPLQLGGVF